MSTRKRGKLAVKNGREAQVPRVRNPVDPRPGRINTNAAPRLLRWSKTVQLVLLPGALHHGLNPKPAASEVCSKVAFTAWLRWGRVSSEEPAAHSDWHSFRLRRQ